MKLNWFSPLPPAGTEIANYTARLLPLLLERAEVVLWTDQAEWDPALSKLADVRRYQGHPWPEMNRGDLTIYHIGNHTFFHKAIWQASRQQPGMVILHDSALQHFFCPLGREPGGDPMDHVRAMARIYGPAGQDAAVRYWRQELLIDDLSRHFPLTELAAENALGVLVHNRELFAALGHDRRRALAYAPLPYAAPALRRSHSVGPPYRLIVFGQITHHRRLEAVLAALGGLPEREHFRLEVFGRIWEQKALEASIRQWHLDDRVVLRGFVPESDLDAALASAHLAINLRYPTMGEASASQLRIWGHALPSLVTPVGWYASLPETTVGFVCPDCEVQDIQSHLRALLANPAAFARMGREGRRLLDEQHRPESYVDTLMELATSAAASRSRTLATWLGGRVAREMSIWLDGNGLDADFSRVAGEIHRLAG